MKSAISELVALANRRGWQVAELSVGDASAVIEVTDHAQGVSVRIRAAFTAQLGEVVSTLPDRTAVLTDQAAIDRRLHTVLGCDHGPEAWCDRCRNWGRDWGATIDPATGGRLER